MKRIILLINVLLYFSVLSAQDITQTIRGRIVDQQSKLPLPGVNVVVKDTDPLIGTVSGGNGYFQLEEIPIGRQTVFVSMIGYEPVTIKNINVNSGKEVVLNIEMEEKVIETEEVVVKAYRKDRPINEMATISARSFSVEETEKYAGSWGDPSRMATNYAGVSVGGSQINDIIIRGNSPAGLLWRLEGVNIPNPNHFGSLGSTGGPISMLNNNVLANSDFYTGAFPAEYGNALAGAFDLRMRPGNSQKREYLAQVGFNGFEFGLEGPFSKKHHASYLANYRYSTMGVVDKLGIEMGIGAVPYYQDLTFKFNFPSTRLGSFSVFGLGGLSHIDFALDDVDTSFVDCNPNNEMLIDTLTGGTHFTSDMGVVGFSHTYFFNKNVKNAASLKTRFAVSKTKSTTADSIFENKIKSSLYGQELNKAKWSINSELHKKFSASNSIEIGFVYDYNQISFVDSFYHDKTDRFYNRYNIEGEYSLIQSFAQWKHKFSDDLTLNSGVHFQYFDYSEDYAIEPRLGLKWKMSQSSTLSAGYGLHSQKQADLMYFYKTLVDTADNQYISTNKELEFSKSHHFVVGYEHSFTPNLRFKIETYYQYLYNIPVERDESYFSLINFGLSYYLQPTDSLVNEGMGRNYGVDITFEKFLHNNYYFLATLSLFDSKYEGSDGVLRHTIYNGQYVANLLGGYEFNIGNTKQHALAFDVKMITAGGMRSVPVKEAVSQERCEVVYDYENAFERQHKAYFRLDLRISYKMNMKRFSQEWALDITNLTGRQNHFIETYDPEEGKYEEVSQQGFMPMMFWRIVF